MAYITTGIGFDTDLYEEMDHLRDKYGISRSQWIQSALRRYHKLMKRNNIGDFIESLNDSEFEILKEEIKKGSR